MSTQLLSLNNADVVDTDESDVRSTVTVVDNDAIPAVADSAPDTNEVQTDPDTGGGLTAHAIAPAVTPSAKAAVDPSGNANTDYAAPINRQVSTSGTAAEREASGEWGHGTLKIVEGIEPVVTHGSDAVFDNVYFSAGDRTVQEGVTDYMTPARYPDAADADGRAAQEASRQAAEAALYARFIN